MLASLTHDIRTPLAVLTLNAELLLRRAEASGLRDAGARIKAATVMLGRQVDHLVNLAHLPNDELRPAFERLDFAELVRARKAEAEAQSLVTTPFECRFDGDARGDFDGALLAEAVDHLLLLAAINADGAPVSIEVDGSARRAVLLRISFASVLSDAAAMHLFGGGVAVDGVASPRVGIALQRPERIARAHGGSLIGRSKEREGTMFELLLPRTTMH
jgi:signal transduction histidine kinase